MRIARAEKMERKSICPQGTVADMLKATPPNAIGEGHQTLQQERRARKLRLTFGSIPRFSPPATRGTDWVVRGPDKRTRPEPEKAVVAPRTETIRFF